MNNVVNVFPNRWKDTLQAGGVSYGNTVQLVAARSIVHKSLKRSPAWTKPERVLKGLLWALRLASINERFNSRRKLKKEKTKKSSLKKLEMSGFTEVVQWIEDRAEQRRRICRDGRGLGSKLVSFVKGFSKHPHIWAIF